MKACVFAGTFDPFTCGHAYVVESCLKMFDKVIVAVGENVDKSPMFTLDERVQMINAVYSNEKRVIVKTFSGMLTDFMKENDITVNVRGVRDYDDYKYETTMARYNKDLFGEIITVYLPTPNELTYVSSSAVRNILQLKNDATKYIPSAVADYIYKK